MNDAAQSLSNERVVYLNGEYIPESRATIPIGDRGFIFGDAVFDTARTFNGTCYRMDEHVQRLLRSLRYVRIDPGLDGKELAGIAEDVIARNRHLLADGEDYWVFWRITRGTNYPDGPGGDTGPTVLVTCVPLPFAKRAHLFRDGIDVVIPSARRTPPESLSPAAKTHNYLNLIVAGLENETSAPDAWPVLLDTRGFLTEGSGSNIFLVQDGVVRTPKRQYVLAGVSRAVSMQLCRDLGIEIIEDDLSPFDAATADEVFITSTSLCLCPVRSIDGAPIGDGSVPGPVTQRLTKAYIEDAGTDFVAQYLQFLSD